MDAMPGGWFDACLLGVTGDWALRAVIDCSAGVVPVGPDWGATALALLLLAAGSLALARARVHPSSRVPGRGP